MCQPHFSARQEAADFALNHRPAPISKREVHKTNRRRGKTSEARRVLGDWERFANDLCWCPHLVSFKHHSPYEHAKKWGCVFHVLCSPGNPILPDTFSEFPRAFRNAFPVLPGSHGTRPPGSWWLLEDWNLAWTRRWMLPHWWSLPGAKRSKTLGVFWFGRKSCWTSFSQS